MSRRGWLLLVAACAVPLLVWGFDRAHTIHWVGHTDLEVEFVLTEADSGKPIPGARVEVRSGGGFYEEQDKQQFVLPADAGGVARKECRRSMCFGTDSGLGFRSTFAVHLPWWRFRASAPGFEPSEWVDLDVLPFRQRAHRIGPGRAKLVIPIALHRRPA